MTQLLKMCEPEEFGSLLEPLQADQKHLIFFAMNDNNSPRAGGTHWSLLVYCQMEETFYSCDSVDNLNKLANKKFVQNMKNGLQRSIAELNQMVCAQQMNSHDCGIFLLANVENICDYYLQHGVVQNVPVLTFSPSNKRQEILNLITSLGGRLEDESSLPE